MSLHFLFFCQYRIWVLLRLRHWKPCCRSWHNLWRLDLWATGHYRCIVTLRLAGQRFWLDQWNNAISHTLLLIDFFFFLHYVVTPFSPCVIEHLIWVSLPFRPVWSKPLFERRQVWRWCRWELCVFVSWTIYGEKVSDRCEGCCTYRIKKTLF